MDAVDGEVMMEDEDLVRIFKHRKALVLLEQAPEIAVRAVTAVRPSGGGSGVRVDGGDKARMPLNASALDDANDLYSGLAKWALGHAHKLALPLPATLLGHARLEQAPSGFPSWAGLTDVYQLTWTITVWLKGYDSFISSLSVAPVYWNDVRELVEPLRMWYRPEAKAHVVASRDCPVCGRHRTVIVNLDDDSEEVTAACVFCGFVVPHTYTKKYLEVEP